MSEPSPWSTGPAGRCPRCGQGRLFDGFLHVASRCTSCGLDLSDQDSGDGPAAFVVLIVGFIVVGAALIVEVKYEWPVWLHLLVWLPLTVILCLAFLRPLKGLMIALQYRYRRHEFDAGG
ncbi:MAG: DUF983 domain-containing protein [Geminicoccaceae bacterium]